MGTTNMWWYWILEWKQQGNPQARVIKLMNWFLIVHSRKMKIGKPAGVLSFGFEINWMQENMKVY